MKALGRRAQSRVQLGMLKSAREDLEHAKQVLWREEHGTEESGGSKPRKVPSSLVSLERDDTGPLNFAQDPGHLRFSDQTESL